MDREEAERIGFSLIKPARLDRSLRLFKRIEQTVPIDFKLCRAPVTSERLAPGAGGVERPIAIGASSILRSR